MSETDHTNYATRTCPCCGEQVKKLPSHLRHDCQHTSQ